MNFDSLAVRYYYCEHCKDINEYIVDTGIIKRLEYHHKRLFIFPCTKCGDPRTLMMSTEKDFIKEYLKRDPRSTVKGLKNE